MNEQMKFHLREWAELLMVKVSLEVMRDAFAPADSSLWLRCDRCVDTVIQRMKPIEKILELLTDEYNR